MGEHRSSAARQGHRPSPLGRAALVLIDAGFYVFPVTPREKKPPLTEHGCLDASVSTPQVEAWWRRWPEANIGIACGPSRLLIVDLDGNAALSVWSAFEETFGGTPTLTSETGDWGWHLLFSDEAGEGRNTAGLLGPGIDTRGPGGYIIAPPSIHPNGRRYRWMGERRQIAAAPDWMLKLLHPAPARVETERFPQGHSSILGHARLEAATQKLGEQQPGNRHTCLYWASCLAGELIAAGSVSEDHARWLLTRAVAKNGLAGEDPADVLRTIADGFARGSGAA